MSDGGQRTRLDRRQVLSSLGAVSVLGGCGDSPKDWDYFRFCLTLAAGVDGNSYLASSVIEARYWKHRGGGGGKPSDEMIGTAPIIEFGRFGWIILPMSPGSVPYNWPENSPGRPRRQGRFHYRYPYLSDLPFIATRAKTPRPTPVGKLRIPTPVDVLELWKEGGFPKFVDFPQLVWVPPKESDRGVLPLRLEELPIVVGHGASINSLTIVETGERVITKLPSQPPVFATLWRQNPGGGVRGDGEPPRFNLNAYHLEMAPRVEPGRVTW
jgi:hypothetical protein